MTHKLKQRVYLCLKCQLSSDLIINVNMALWECVGRWKWWVLPAQDACRLQSGNFTQYKSRQTPQQTISKSLTNCMLLNNPLPRDFLGLVTEYVGQADRSDRYVTGRLIVCHHGCQSGTQIGSYCQIGTKMWKIWDSLRSVFSTFWLAWQSWPQIASD